MTGRRILLLTALGLIGMGVLTGVAAVMFPDGWIPVELVGTVFVAGGFTLGAMIAVALAGLMARTLVVCLVVLALSAGGYIALIWLGGFVPWGFTEWLMRISSGLLIVAITLMHRMILASLRSRSGIGRVNLRVAVISAPTAALIALSLLFLEGWWGGWDDLVVRLLGVALIIAAGSSVAAGVVAYFERRPEHDDPGVLGDGIAVMLTCPRCSASIDAVSNRASRCGSCRLKVRVEVEEPRCVCGYLLYQLNADACPECGRPVAVEDRWDRAGGVRPGVGRDAETPSRETVLEREEHEAGF